MRKKELNNLVKLVKNEKKKNNKDYNGITFNPTLEECDYLYSKGVISYNYYSVRPGFLVNNVFYNSTGHSFEN